MRTGSILAYGGAFVGLAGCGSYWDLPSGEELPYGCAGQINWYTDGDGDGFGAPGGAPEQSCELVNGRAPNQLDCDDADPAITGRVGTLCPSELGSGYRPDEVTGVIEFQEAPSTCFEGVVAGGIEYVGTCGVPRLRFNEAATDCQHWAGWGAEGDRGLAILDQQGGAVEELLNTLHGAEPDLAVWIDLRWSATGDALTEGEWLWPDGSAPTATYPPCGGVYPVPVEFWPDVNANDPDARAGMEASLPDLRLALVPNDGGWCIGLPSSVGTSPREAFPLCQRPAPIGLDYEERAEAAPE